MRGYFRMTTAESGVPQQVPASMGPRRFRRGCQHARRRESAQSKRFNETATVPSWMPMQPWIKATAELASMEREVSVTDALLTELHRQGPRWLRSRRDVSVADARRGDRRRTGADSFNGDSDVSVADAPLDS
jgi:hypothetical protein